VHSPLLQRRGHTFEPLLWVGDWCAAPSSRRLPRTTPHCPYHAPAHHGRYATLLGAALSRDTPAERAAAEAVLAPLLAAGPIDSVDQWAALAAAAPTGDRTELVLAGYDVDRASAAVRVGQYKLLVGGWGTGTWCDLNVSGASPAYPVPPGNASQGKGGGEGGLWCMALDGERAAAGAPPMAGGQPVQLYDVVADPREQHDLASAQPDVVARLLARLAHWNATTAPTIHAGQDPAGHAHANATDCWGPWA
jgi:hypothetical protein